MDPRATEIDGELVVRLEGWRNKGIKEIAKSATMCDLGVTVRVSIEEIYVSGFLTLCGFGLSVDMDIDRRYGYGGGSLFISTPLGVINLDVTRTFSGIGFEDKGETPDCVVGPGGDCETVQEAIDRCTEDEDEVPNNR